MRFDGTLHTWNDDRGFGFIRPTQGGEDIFVHIKAFPPGTGRPAIGLALSFELDRGHGGRKRANSVRFMPSAAPHGRERTELPATWTLPRRLLIPGFAALYLFAFLAWNARPVGALVYLLVSLATFIAYAIDKTAARRGHWRIAESTLHLFSLLGGWPGALLAQQWMRHKTSKGSFLEVYRWTVGINIGFFVVLHAPWFAAARAQAHRLWPISL